ncbi:MAG: thioredoxin domain-containing protein [Pseudomonadota bacterium]
MVARPSVPIAALMALVLVVLGTAVPARAQMPATDPVVVGDPKAPIEVEIYIQATCSACRSLFTTLYDDGRDDGAARSLDGPLRAGAYRITVHPVYYRPVDLWADMLARCSTDYAETMWRVLQVQNALVGGMVHPRKGAAFEKRIVLQPTDLTIKMLRALTVPDLIGDKRFDACIGDKALAKILYDQSEARRAEMAIEATPVLMLGEARYEGSMEAMRAMWVALGID